jgi:hypothetical protein
VSWICHSRVKEIRRSYTRDVMRSSPDTRDSGSREILLTRSLAKRSWLKPTTIVAALPVMSRYLSVSWAEGYPWQRDDAKGRKACGPLDERGGKGVLP